LSLLDLGVSGVSATGKVYYLNKLADFSGSYFATQATFAVAGGGGEVVMANGNGVFVQLSSEQSGTQLTLGASGLRFKLK
jgi:roadblock/LC7 domain-containing protein